MPVLDNGAVYAILIAPFVGSFLGVLALRLPAGAPVILGRSVCDHCGRRLRIAELIPLVSWCALKGRCAGCGGAIDRLLPAIELAAMAVPLWAILPADAPPLWASVLLGWTLLCLAAIDARHQHLPDVLTLPLVPAGLAVALLIDPDRLTADLYGAALGFVVFAGIRSLYRRLRGRDGLGLGDAKLLAAAGAWVGWDGLPSVVLIGTVSALGVAANTQRARPALVGEQQAGLRPLSLHRSLAGLALRSARARLNGGGGSA